MEMTQGLKPDMLRTALKQDTALTAQSIQSEESVSEYAEDELSKGSHQTILTYQNFANSLMKLEINLDAFSHKVQKLGSALELSIAARSVSAVLKKLRKHIERSIQSLQGHLPKAARQDVPVTTPDTPLFKDYFTIASPPSPEKDDELCDIFIGLFRALERLSNAILDFQDYVDSEGEESTRRFIEHVQFVSSCMSHFENECDSSDLQRFVEEMATKMDTHIAATSAMLDRFIDIGIPCISTSQKRSATILLNAATVATFFAGVAATTLQFSVGDNGTPVKIAANSLWFASLALSIGSAVNSLLAMTWRQAVFSSPNQRLPPYIRFWTRQGPIALLITSTLTFLGGLICFVLATQDHATFWMSLACIAFFAIGLTTVSIWFAIERWKFSTFRRSLHCNAWNSASPTTPTHSVLWTIRRSLQESLRLKDIYALPIFRDESSSDADSIMVSGAETEKAPIVKKAEGSTAKVRVWRRARLEPTQINAGTVQNDMSTDAGVGSAPPPLIRPSYGAPLVHRLQTDMTAVMPHGRIGTIYDDGFVTRAKSVSTAISQRVTIKVPSSEAGRFRGGAKMMFTNHRDCIVAYWLYTCAFFRLDEVSGLRFYHYLEDPPRHLRRKIVQMQWSPNGSRLMMGMKRSMSLWELDLSRTRLNRVRSFLRNRNLQHLQWVNDNVLLVLLKDNSIAKVDISLQPDRESDVSTVYGLPPGLSARSLYSLDGRDVVLLIADYKQGEHAISYIVVCQLQNCANQRAQACCANDVSNGGCTSVVITQKVPVSYLVQSLSISEDRNGVLVCFKDNAPELWQRDDDSAVLDGVPRSGIRLKFVRSMSWEPKPPDGASDQHQRSHWGEAMFSGPSDSVAACPTDECMHYWERSSGRHLFSVKVPEATHTVKNEYSDKHDVANARYVWLKFGNTPQIVVATEMNQKMDMTVWRNQNVTLLREEADRHWFRNDYTPSILGRREDSPSQRSVLVHGDVGGDVRVSQRTRSLQSRRSSTQSSHAEVAIAIVGPDDDEPEFDDSDYAESTIIKVTHNGVPA